MGIVKQKRYTCRDIVTSKYERQFDDSVYSTAIAITALAPYCETSGAYTITQNQTGYVLDLSLKMRLKTHLIIVDRTGQGR